MIKNVLQDIGGVGIYGILSICIFFAVFSAAVVWTALRKRSYCEEMSALPLNKDDDAEEDEL